MATHVFQDYFLITPYMQRLPHPGDPSSTADETHINQIRSTIEVLYYQTQYEKPSTNDNVVRAPSFGARQRQHNTGGPPAATDVRYDELNDSGWKDARPADRHRCRGLAGAVTWSIRSPWRRRLRYLATEGGGGQGVGVTSEMRAAGESGGAGHESSNVWSSMIHLVIFFHFRDVEQRVGLHGQSQCNKRSY